MCWIGSKYDMRVAHEDITVYKVVNKVMIYPDIIKYEACFFIWFKYEIGKTYSQEIYSEAIDKSHIEINKGLHCFSPDAWVERMPSLGFSVSFCGNKSDSEHYYTFTFGCASPRTIPVIVKCTIPKGTTYYINDYNEIVTEKLTIVKYLGFPNGRGRIKSFDK